MQVHAWAEGLSPAPAGARLVTLEKKGAGVIIEASGLIVTNAHTVAGAQKIAVKTQDGRQFAAQLIDVSGDDDLALLKIDSETPLPFAPLEDPGQLKPGDTVYSVGNSMFLNQTLSEGIILGIGTKAAGSWGGEPGAALLRISFKVYPGDSGTPVFGRSGKLYGIIAANAGQTSLAVSSARIGQGYRRWEKAQGS